MQAGLAPEFGKIFSKLTIPDQPLHERMRQGNARHRLDFGHVQNAQIGLPLGKPIKRIVVGAEGPQHRPLASNGLVEHPKDCDVLPSLIIGRISVKVEFAICYG